MSGLSAQEEKFACPCPRDGYYDVFISFRGIDTRSGFTDTLYRSLLESKIYTFIDADLAGDVIETLYEIIAKSRMAVVVYSERFASSHWCLTELEIIMQRWKEKKMLMIPIFYKVDAHELKHPTEKTIKYFDEHIIKYGETIVGKWKDAVIKIGNVSGFPYKDIYTRSERDFIITQVITKIKKKLRECGESGQESITSKPYNSGHAATENHDVFISFLGKDTHYDLVSHLNEALVNYKKDIKIFMVDRDLLKDDSIFEVIQRSKMAVIVFSPNYASSKWCLRELVKILQCSNTTGQEFLPIFYEMTQSDLKDQSVKGMIAYHLEKHARNEKSETVQSWRDAITDLGYTVGWRYSTTHSKTEELAHFIQKLVEEISTMLNRVEDEKKESTRNEQEVHESLAKEENTQTLALQTYGEKEFVLTLDHSNFSEITSKHDFIVVEFYSPWCGYSKMLAPEYEKAASILSSNHPRVILAKVDANEDANKELAREHDIRRFPTLKIFRNGGEDVREYNGPLDAAEGIVEYLKKQSGPVSAEIKSAEDASGLIGDNSLVIVGVFPKFSGEEYDNFIALAEKLRSDYEFAHTLNAKLLPHGDSSVSGPLVRLFKPFDELFVDSKDFNVEALEKFFEESSLPLLTLLNTDTSLHRYAKMFFTSQSAKAMLFMNFTNESAESMKAKYREVAEKFKGHDIIFLLGDLEASGTAFNYFGLKEEQVPVIVAVSTDKQKYLKANIQVDDIAPWVKDYKDGKVAAFTKTEPIPKDNSKPVKVVVADSIDDVVFKSGKNVLIEFYAPWCAHCKKLAPILDEVALSFESDPDIVIAKFNASANDITCVAFEVTGYPTLYFRSSTGTILQYDGDRTKEYIIDFIKMNRVP